MEDIRTLIDLLSVQKIKQIEILTEDAPMSPKTRSLYEGIRDGTITNDEQALEKLYGNSGKHAAYRKLKYRLKQRLINTLFFIDVQEYSKSEYQKAYGKALKSWAALSILLDKGLRLTAISIAENTLKTSLRYDMLELSLLLLKDLRFHFGVFDNNNYKYQKYKRLFSHVKTILEIKEEAELYYIELSQLILKSKSYKITEKVEDTELKVNYLMSKINSIDSFYTRFFTYNAAYFIQLIKKDSKTQLKIAEKAIAYFKEKKQFKKIGIFSFTLKKGISLLCLKNYDVAIETFNNCYNLLPKKNLVSSHLLSNYLFTAYIQKKAFQDAYELLSEILNDNYFKKMTDSFKEPWYLKEAFIHFLIRVGRIDVEKSNASKLRPFRLGRFMNEVTVFSKDKRGLNITINIIQLLFLILDERYDDVLDKLNSLKQYNFRYLKRPEYIRQSSFIKMLLKIPDGNYRASKIREKADRYYQLLLDNPSDYSEQALSLEIIPYEQLWEELLSIFPD